jgi:cyclopropane fatty-acyl-phospholipid synthase-like methyltransferase/methyltransferase-like protein
LEETVSQPNVSQALLASYEQFPYESGPQYPTHPDCMSTVAALMGMHPVPVDRCRMLELGCGDGGNLIPMAVALPDSRFVGIDLSPTQIQTGLRTIAALGLSNIELRAADLLEVGEELGAFDYIACHGVFSWVPAEVRAKILAICRRNLEPQGVAYISYNTYPGWHFRGIVKDILHFHTRVIEGPHEKLAEARGLLNFLAESLPAEGNPYASVLRNEAEHFQRDAEHYLYHEFLEEVNCPLYFHQFMEQAAANGLQYLGEAWFHTRLDNLPRKVRETIENISASLIDLEQYLDFLRARTFRRTLLCHRQIALTRRPDAERVLGMSVSAQVWPVELPVDVTTSATVEFRSPRGDTITTNHPAIKTMFLMLFEARPRAILARELLNRIRQRLEGANVDRGAIPDAADFGNLLAQCQISNTIVLHTCPPRFASEVSERPVASPLGRLQAADGRAVVNLRHQCVLLEPFERAVLARLDGSRDRPQLMRDLGAMTEEETFNASGSEQGEVAGLPLDQRLDATLWRIAHAALLVS